MTDREVMQMALVQMGKNQWFVADMAKHVDVMAFNSAMEALRAQLEQPEREPVAWMHDCAALLQNDVELWVDRCPHCGKPRTTPPAAQRKPLTDEQIAKLMMDIWGCASIAPRHAPAFARAIEAAHGIGEKP